MTSAGHCLHCDTDLSTEIAAAVHSLNTSIQQTLDQAAYSQPALQQTPAAAARP